MLSWQISDDGTAVKILLNGKVELFIPKEQIDFAAINKNVSKHFPSSLTLKGNFKMSKRKSDLRMTVTEAREFSEWLNEHMASCEIVKKQTEVFSSVHFTKTSNGIGQNLVVCCDCGTEHDITDVSSW